MHAMPVGKVGGLRAAERHVAACALPRRPAPTVEFVPFVLHVTPGEPPSLLPPTIAMEPVNNPCREPIAPSACFGASYRGVSVGALGRRRRGKRRQHFRFVRSEEFDDRLRTFGAADEELVAYGFDAKSHFLGATQERYSVHSPSSSAMVRSDAIPPASRGRSPAAPLAFRRRSSGADSVPSMLDCRSLVSVGVDQGSLAACKPPSFTSMSLPAASCR